MSELCSEQPHLYFLLTETDQHQGFFETENWIRQYAHDYNIPLYGSYDPTCIKGLDETDFFDGLHCKGCGICWKVCPFGAIDFVKEEK